MQDSADSAWIAAQERRLGRMIQTLGIVDACFRTDKERRRAAGRLQGKSVLEWVSRRATDCQQLDGVIVVTTADPANDFVKDLVPLDVPVFAAEAEDVLSLWAKALEAYPCEKFVRFETVCPFVDRFLVDRLVKEARRLPEPADYVGYRTQDGTPAMLSSAVLYGELVLTKTLHRLNEKLRSAEDRQHPTKYIYMHPDRFRVHWIPVPEKLDRRDIRLVLVNEDDWEVHQIIVDTLGPDCDGHHIAGLIEGCPSLRRQMEAINLGVGREGFASQNSLTEPHSVRRPR